MTERRQADKPAPRIQSRATNILIVLMLAVGIGSSTAVFSLLNQLLINPVHVREPERLLVFREFALGRDGGAPVSMPMVRRLEESARTLSGLAAHTTLGVSVAVGGSATFVRSAIVTGGYFDVLGITAAQGRTIARADESAETSVAVISERLSYQLYGQAGAPNGAVIQVNGEAVVVVGTTPTAFRGTDLLDPVDIWLPTSVLSRLMLEAGATDPLNDWEYFAFTLTGRLAPQITPEVANSEMHSLYARLDAARPRAPVRQGVMNIRVPSGDLQSIPFKKSVIITNRASLELFLNALAGATAICLVICCVNVANLMMLRTAQRTKEFAIRAAVGATPFRIFRQLLTESLALGGAACLCGIGAAWILIGGIKQLEMPGGIEVDALNLRLDPRVLLFAVLTSLSCVVLFGVTPALRARRSAITGTYSELRQTGTMGRLRDSATLVALQVAFSIVLLSVGLMFVRSLHAAMSVNLGFRSDGIATVAVALKPSGYSAASAPEFMNRLLTIARQRGEVSDFGFATRTPLFRYDYAPAIAEGLKNGETTGVDLVGGDFFQMLGIQLVKGRLFDDRDRPGSQPVAIISENVAKREFPGEDPIGKTIWLLPIVPGAPHLIIVGVVRDAHFISLENYSHFIFLPISQQIGFAPFRAMQYMEILARSRTGGSPIRLLRDVVREADPGVAPFQPRMLDEKTHAAMMPQRFGSLVLTLFGLISLMVCGLGIYAVAGFEVARRHRELGVRTAIGASPLSLIGTVLGRSGLAIAIGCGVGLMLAVFVGRALRMFMYGTDPDGVASYIAATAFIAVTAGLATVIPARRAATVNPLDIMRE